jgi:hypothetical protein
MKLIGGAFFALALYVLAQSVYTIWQGLLAKVSMFRGGARVNRLSDLCGSIKRE